MPLASGSVSDRSGTSRVWDRDRGAVNKKRSHHLQARLETWAWLASRILIFLLTPYPLAEANTRFRAARTARQKTLKRLRNRPGRHDR